MRENRLYGSVGGWGLNRPPPTQSFQTAPRFRPHHVSNAILFQSLASLRLHDRHVAIHER